jgi:uncharacterized membrane protein YfcA
MGILEIIGFISSLLIGISLGLIGGGGSILTVPVLVYLLGVEPVLATSYSLLIVGLTASVGAVQNYRKGLVSLKTAVVFAIPSFIAVFLTRYYIMPAIPDNLINIGDFSLTKPIAVMVFFAVIMLLAAFSMIRSGKKKELEDATVQEFNYPMIILEGAVVGVLTGLVGAGGGFLIIPALVLLAKLPMKQAVGTSLLIIAVKSLVGFTGDIAVSREIDWILLSIVSILAVAGIFVGSWLSNYIHGSNLKKGFGWFVLAMAVFIILKELL